MSCNFDFLILNFDLSITVFLLNFTDPLSLLFFIIALSFTIAVHEYSHAKMADYLGDPTARLAGRLTLNPIAHLDPVGLIFLLIFGFGWGKPVPFDPFNLKNPRKGAALISIVGPGSNFIMATVGGLLFRLPVLFNLSLSQPLTIFLSLFIYLNIILGVFNLLPFAPLDGFKIVGGILSEDQADEWYRLERYGIIFLLFFILPLVGNRSMLGILLSPLIKFLTNLLIPAQIPVRF